MSVRGMIPAYGMADGGGSAMEEESPGTTGSAATPGGRSGLRRLARLTFGNPVSLGYLALVLAAVAFAVLDGLVTEPADASFSGVWALLLTAPTIFPLWLAGDALWGGSGAPDGYLMASAAVAALVNALLLGLAHRAVRGPRRSAVGTGWHTRRHGDH
ncbi:SCO4225 family membrane protein [Streptomyces sp. NPDC017993]|uniref:SCO4225 family membrane protein n=1 Tax=Streptomyces sp. NPDC017993 TaxID=3365027 RepID=UPI0037912E6A